MTPEERAATEDKIKQMIQEKLSQAMHVDANASPAEASASQLQELLDA